MGKTIPQSGSPALFFLDELHRAGLKDRDIDGAVSDDAVGGPSIGVCREGGARDGKVDKGEIFATAFNNLVKHGDTLKRYFQKIGLNEISFLQNDGQLEAGYRERLQQELLSEDPRRSLRAWPNPKKLAFQDPGYASELLQWASRHTRLPLLPYKEQVIVLKQLGLDEGRVKGELGKLWQGQTLPKLVAHASVLRGEEMRAEAKARRAVGDAKEAQALEQSALRLFRTAVEMDGNNPDARRHLAESLEAQGRFREAGLHYGQALASEPNLDGILDILGRLSGANGSEMLGRSHDAFSFVAFALKGAGRYPEAALIFHRAAEAATLAGHREQSLAFTEQELLAQEETSPYLRQFSSDSNPVANAIYGALREAGIPSALMDGASGKEGDVPDRKIGAAEVFGYLDGHGDDARVQAALKKIHFHVPWLDAKGQLKKSFDTLEFSKQSFAQRMGAWHASEAALLGKLPAGGNEAVREKHLRMASYYEPEAPGPQRALGDFYAGRGEASKARDAYLKAVGLDPADKTLQAPLGRTLAATGDYRGAIAAFDVFLQAHPGDAAILSQRTEAVRDYQGDLRKSFDTELLRFHSLSQVKPEEALASLKTLEGLAKELETVKDEDPLDRLQNLQRTQTFYDSVVNLEAAHGTYDRETVWQAKSRLYKVFGEAVQSVRDSLKVPVGGTPTREQIHRGAAFITLESDDKDYRFGSGLREDLQAFAKLIDQAPSDQLDTKARGAAYDQLFAAYGKSVKLHGKYANDRDGHMAEAMHQAGNAMLTAQFGTADSPDKKRAAEVLNRLIDDADVRLLSFASCAGLRGFVAKTSEAETAFQAALKVEDVRERRGALIQVIGAFAKLQDEKKVGEVLAQLQATSDDKMVDNDKLQILTAAYLSLRDSGLPQESQLLNSSKLLAFKMSFLRDTSSPSNDVKRLLLLKSYYETVADPAGTKKIAGDLYATRDALINELYFGKPSEGKKAPTDPKERLELASLSVQIDQALLSDDIAGTVGKLTKEERTTLYMSRLDVWRKELAKAGDLPYAERLAQARGLAQSAATYRALCEGDQAFLDKTKVEAGTQALETEIVPMLKEFFAQEEGATAAQQALAEKITQDLQDRFHAALSKGDAGSIANLLSGEAMVAFGEKAQMAHGLLAEAGGKFGPKAVQARLEAASLFLELGLDSRVKETMGPVQAFAMKLRDPRQKAGMLFTVTQAYQQAGLTKEANAALQAVVDLDAPSATAETRDLSVLARGMQQLNDGDLVKAREILAGIPKNPMAQMMLAKLAEGTEQRRLRMTFDALAPVLFSIYQGKNTDLTDAQASEIRDKVQATLQRWQKQLASGEIRSLDDAFRNDLGGFYHESFEGEVTKSFLSRISNPDMTDQEFSRTLLGFSRGMLRAEKYAAAMGIAQLFEQDPQMSAAAKAILADIPGQARWDGILRSLKNMTIIFADSDAEALKSAAIMIVSFGVGRLLAVGAEAAWVARAATFIRSPIVLRASTFAVKTTAEAAGFTLGSMTMETIWTGKTNHWNVKHFGTEFGSMLVTFVLLHGVGMGMQGFSASSARYLGRAEAGMARALEGGGGLGSAAFNVRLATGMNAVAKSGVTAWGSRVLAFTGTEYVNEAIGLRPKENIPFWIRLAGSAVTDAQMMLAGKGLDAVSGGRISKLEKATQAKLAQHQVNFQAKELLPLVERMGFDAKSPAGRMVWEALLSSRMQGESLKAIEARTSAAEIARLEKAVADSWGLDPKSPEGQRAKAQLLTYAQVHPFSASGKPLGTAEVAELSAKLSGEAGKLLREAGIERGPAFEALRRGILSFALQGGLEPAQLGEYARNAKGLQVPLKAVADGLLGPDAAKTPEGQELMGELAVYAMFRAPSAEKFAEPLEALSHLEWGGELPAMLQSSAETLFGKGGQETPAGRAWMARLFLNALHGSQGSGEVATPLKAKLEIGAGVAPLADISGLHHPKDRLILASWALENEVAPEVLRGMVSMVLKGEIQISSRDGGLHILKVPAAEQAARAAEVRERLPELPSELLREDKAATALAEEEILPVTEDMIVSGEPLGPFAAKVEGEIADADATKPGKKIKPIETTVAGKKSAVEALAARKGLTPKPAAEAPILVESKKGMTALPSVEGPIPEVELSVGEERLKLSFDAGDVIPLGEKAGKLNFGAEVKEAKAEIAVLRNERGELVFHFRTVGEAKGQELQRGDKLRVGDLEFLWEGPQILPKPELKSVPLEPTKNEGVPKADRPPTLKGNIGLSETEISAHAFLDFYFGEEGSVKTLDAFVARSEGAERNSWVDAAVDFRRTLGSFQTKVAQYDALEREFDLHRANFLEAKEKDPARAKESARLAEEALKVRSDLELEIARDLKALAKEPYNQLELQYHARLSKAEKEAIPLDFALAAAEVEAAIAARGTEEKQALRYQLVFKPLGEISENHYDYEFNRLALGELVHAEVSVTRWEVAERTLRQMVDEGVLKPEQIPDFEALRAGGAKEFEVSAEISGSGKMRVVFHFEGKVEETSGAVPSEGGKPGGLGLTGALLGLTTLLTPEIARASDGAGGGADASLLPWVLGVGAALITAAGGAYLWAKARPDSKTSETGGAELRKRRSSASDKISQDKPLTQGPLNIPSGKGVGRDLLSFLGDRPSLVDRTPVPGMNRNEMRRLESIFEKGGYVMEMELPGGSKMTRLVELVTGAATINAMPVGEEVVQFYNQWKQENGFQSVDALTARRAWKELNQRAKKAGIQIEFEGPSAKGRRVDPKELQENIDYHGAPIAYLNELMKLLPDSMLQNPRLKHLYLDTGRQGAGELSCYEPKENAVYLFHGAFRGSRRYLAALFFHEIGHSTAERYKPGADGDPSIPAGVRSQMAKSVEILSRKNAMLGLDWSLGAEERAAYQRGSLTEFLAELNLMYVTAGPKLRAHIESFPEGSPERQAWDFAYGEMKSRIFEGLEYGYDGEYRPPAKKAAEPAKTEILPVQVDTPMPKPVLGPVEMALADNAPGAGRQGKAENSKGTEEYGTFSVVTDEGTGYHKDHNEDGFVQGRNWGLVLDGMGGMGSGDKASEIAGKKFAEEMAAHGDLLRATLAAGRAINESPYHSGGTTSVAHQIVRRADGTYVAKLVVTGDAAAILFRRDANGKYVYDPKLRTEEQSQAALLRKAGRIANTLQARASDIANVVTGGLGLGREAKPDTYEYEIRKGDYLLSFSDGIGDNVSGEELVRILNSSRSAAEVQDKISDLVHWKMEKLAKARAVAKGRSQDGVLTDSFVDSEDRFHWRVELNDMPGYTIDEKGHVYDSANKMVDHYKSDNLTIHVYSHDVLEPPAGRASEVTVTMPVVDVADLKTVILPLPKVEPRWTPSGEWVLPKGFRSVIIGSDGSKGARVLMPDPLVSRQHAEIFEAEGEYWVRDKGSLNGTFVEGQRLIGEEAHVLDSGALVSFGGRSYQFDIVGDQAKLTPVLAVSPGQGTVAFGGITLFEGDPGVYFVRNEGKVPVQVDGASLEANGQAYRIRDGESVKLGQQKFLFRIR